MNAVMAPKPTPPSARPRPGIHTARATLPMAAGCCSFFADAERNGTMIASAPSGMSTVATEIAVKPPAVYSAVPAGAPTANAA